MILVFGSINIDLVARVPLIPRPGETVLAPGYELEPNIPPIAAEAIGGAIYALVYDQVKSKGPESLPELVPMATYMTLAPFLGADEAFALATGAAENGKRSG